MSTSALTTKVWSHLIAGKSLDRLGFPTIDGRVDLRGLPAPTPSLVREYQTKTANVKELGNLTQIRGAHWKGIDFSNSHLHSLRFFDSYIEDCCFDRADCEDWRMWGTTISGTSFKSANLGRSGLGGIDNGKRNCFRQLDFSNADLRRTAHKSADFTECIFRNTNLKKVDFQGSVFVDCVFEGDLDEVLFYHHAFRGEAFPPNEMRRVDFRRARFHFVEFRRLDMDDVKWPEDDQHIIVKDYKTVLDRLLDILNTRSDVASRKMAAVFGNKRKWAGPNQREGVISKHDLIYIGGEGAVNEFLELLAQVAPD